MRRRAGACGTWIAPSDNALSYEWVTAIHSDPAKLAALTQAGGWKALVRPAGTVWTDDYASILPHLTWRNFL